MDVVDYDGKTPLHVATGCIDVAKVLIKNGIDVNAADDEYFTALHFAAENGDS